ncbi:MAG: hypothetical protein ACOCV1_05405, partial [Bacillota bacterium]
IITRAINEEDFSYKQSSSGERKKIDLAISLAFSHLMRIRSGLNCNILFLDELAESLDEDGIEGIYKSLLELSKDKTIFVITHIKDLLFKLESYPEITVKKENGFTSIEL